jgi:hypothetical protein
MAESPESILSLLEKQNQLPKRICRSNGFAKNGLEELEKWDGAYY